MATENEILHSLAGQIDSLRRASKSIAQAIGIVPENQLFTAIQRGFRVWPYHAPPVAAPLASVLQSVVDHVRIATGAEMAALGVGRFPHHPFEPWVVSGVPEELRKQLGVPYPIGTLGAVAIHGRKIRTKDIHTDSDFRGLPKGHPEIRSFMALPIRVNNLSLGNLYVANKIGQEEFTAEDESIVEVLAQLAVLAIQQTYISATMESQQSQVQALLDSVPSGVVFVDKASAKVTANETAMQLFQRPLTDVQGTNQYRQYVFSKKGESLAPSQFPSARALEGETVIGQELRIRRADGTMIPIRVNAAPVFGIYRQIIGAVVVFENISMEKRLDQMRRRLAMTIVHDIKNPTQAIELSAQLIEKNAGIDDSVKKNIRLIRQNAERIAVLSNRLLEAARIESAQIKLDLRLVDLKIFLDEVVKRASAAYPDSKIITDFPKDRALLKIDPERMEQALTNLIDNAVKYSPKGTPIRIGLELETSGFDISVRDYGPGIEREILPHLFEPYVRGETRESPMTGGLGLGLFIIKGITEAHGGTVTVENAKEGGSIFRLHIPLNPHESVAA